VDLSDRARQVADHRDHAPMEPTVVAGHTHELDRTKAPVYNVLGNSRELSERSIHGYVRLLQERVRYPAGYEFGELQGRMVIETDDGDETLEGSYMGVFRAGPAWHWLNAAAGSQPSRLAQARAARLEAKAFISMYFDAGSTKYAWLARYQCIGYGRLELNAGSPLSATFDIYSLDPPS
jgi:hypothetical protein